MAADSASVTHPLGTLRFSPILARTAAIHAPIGPHAYDCVKLAFVRSGAALLIGEFGTRTVLPGDVVLLAANTLHAALPQPSLTLTVLYLDHDYLVDQLFWQYAAVMAHRLEARKLIDTIYAETAQVLHLGVDRAGYLMPWLDEMVAMSIDRPRPARFYRMEALLFSIVDVVAPYVNVTLTRESRTQRRTTMPSPPRHREFAPLRVEARRAAALLQERPERRWTLAELAWSVHLSPSQLGRVFVDSYGKSPISYLTMIRAEKMAALLRETDEAVSLVARRVGWVDPDYATRQFRRYVGMTPRRYRRLDPSPAPDTI